MSCAKRPRTGVIFSVDEFLAENPECTMDSMILGIDEAGRGPVIGSMVYSGGMVPLRFHNELVQCGVADSKQLTEVSRTKVLRNLQALEPFEHFTVCLSAERIAQDQLGRRNKNLNTLSKESAIDIIHAATMCAKGKLAAVYVDTVGKPEVYEHQLRQRFPHLRITVTTKADSKYPIVSAASIIAKTTRDALVERIPYAVGSGYPADPTAALLVRTKLHRFFGYNPCKYDFVRFSWAPVAALMKAHCAQVTFEQDLMEKEPGGGERKQKRLSVGPAAIPRDPLLSEILGLRSAA